ncbi:MAG: signal peptidase [Thermoleophilaceae bacterium]|jgi:signal peptidase II|nr:signal peptidase [Thermoleophilaceae bacterium]
MTAWARAGAVALAAVVLDQLSKAAIVGSFRPGQSDRIFYGIELTFVKNDGIAFGALGGGGTLILILVGLSVLLLLGYFARHSRDRLLWLPVGMILGGAIGNVADRVRLGYVVDFIDPMFWPAFNLADVFIVLGVGGFILLLGSSPDPKPAT